MKSLRPVRWKEGLFLRPHHFQQQEIYLASREAWRLLALDPYAWGVVQFEVDEDSLGNYVLQVRSLRAILRDGTFIDVPRNARIAPAPFESLRSEAGKSLAVSVGVRIAEEGRAQTAQELDGQARFSVHPDEVFDVDIGRDPFPIELLDYNLRLFLGEEPTAGYETLPLATLEKTADPARPIALARDHAPPCVVLSASSFLYESARSVVDLLDGRLKTITQKSLATENPREIAAYQMLAASLPVLRDMVSDGGCHPRRVYQELARLAGALYFRQFASRSLDEIPAYDHADPASGFHQLRMLIDRWSADEVVQKFISVELKRDNDYFSADLPPAAKNPSSRCLLALTALESAARIKSLMRLARISSPTRMETLVGGNMLGVPTEPAPRPEEIPAGKPAQYFRLDQMDADWMRLVTAGRITVQIHGVPADVGIQLIVIPPRT